MSLGLVYWVLMLLWLLFGVWVNYPTPNGRQVGHSALLFILLLVIGWAVFGAPVKT